jgi:hypothetical protein
MPRNYKARRARVACAQCGIEFDQARSDARFCGTACRVASHRARRTDDAVETDRLIAELRAARVRYDRATIERDRSALRQKHEVE